MRALLLLPLLAACDPAKSGPDAPAAGAPTYHADVRPILDQSCARCHTEGGIAFSLDDAETAVSMAAAMKAAVESGQMPPPAPDPACRDYESSARFTLTDAQRATIGAWADAGAPLGDPADAPGTRDDSLVSLAPYDLELWASQPYTPVFPADGNDYRCFLFDVGNAETTWITGMQALVDNTSIVHHVVLFDPNGTDDLWDEGDPHDGFSCSGLGQANWATLGAWGPGANPTVLPDGMGIRLEPNDQVILQVHYYDSFDGADMESDRSGYGLLLTDTVTHEAVNYAAGPTSFTLEAGDADATARQLVPLSEDAQILGVWPHMHLLGTAFEERVTHGDGSETCLLRMDAYSFHNQVQANFLEPVAVAAGDRIRITCHYDNSAANPNQYNDPPEDVAFGEGTNDEMCFGFTLVATPVE
ncbi:MAG: hypothetical protein ACK4YP_18245 [Myxococcota bacterium]